MKIKIIFLTVLISSLFLSCQQEDTIVGVDESKSAVAEFTYEGRFYSSRYSINPIDSSVIFDDIEVRAIATKLQNLSELAILVSNDSITYFDTNKQMNDFLDKKQTITTRASTSFKLTLYEHDTFRGRTYEYKNNTHTSAVGVSDLKTVNFGDIMSSFILTSETNNPVRVTFYEHDSYKGASISFIAYTQASESDMNNFKYGGVIGIGSHRWGDKVSSFLVN